VVRAADAPRCLAATTRGRFAQNDVLSHSGGGEPLAAITAKKLNVTQFCAAARKWTVCTPWHMPEAWEPVAKTPRIIGRCGASQGQTFITHRSNDPAPIRAVLVHAITHLPRHHVQTLGIFGLVAFPDTACDIPLPAHPQA